MTISFLLRESSLLTFDRAKSPQGIIWNEFITTIFGFAYPLPFGIPCANFRDYLGCDSFSVSSIYSNFSAFVRTYWHIHRARNKWLIAFFASFVPSSFPHRFIKFTGWGFVVNCLFAIILMLVASFASRPPVATGFLCTNAAAIVYEVIKVLAGFGDWSVPLLALGQVLLPNILASDSALLALVCV